MTTPPIPAPTQVAFPPSQGKIPGLHVVVLSPLAYVVISIDLYFLTAGPELSLPISVITALKSGCASTEQLLQLTSFLLSYGSALEATHSGNETLPNA